MAKSARAARTASGSMPAIRRAASRPRLLRGVAGDDVEPDAEPQRPVLGPAGGIGQGTHPLQTLTDHVGGLAPRQVDVDMTGCDAFRRRRRSTEVHLGSGVGCEAGRCALHPVVLAIEVEGLVAPRAVDHLEELAGTLVALVLRAEVTEAGHLDGFRADDDVEQQSSAGHALIGRRHLRRERRVHHPGPERHEEPQPMGQRDERRRGDPRVLAPGAARSEHRIEPQSVTRPGDIGQVGLRRRATMGVVAGGQHVAAVAAGGEEPVDLDL